MWGLMDITVTKIVANDASEIISVRAADEWQPSVTGEFGRKGEFILDVLIWKSLCDTGENMPRWKLKPWVNSEE